MLQRSCQAARLPPDLDSHGTLQEKTKTNMGFISFVLDSNSSDSCGSSLVNHAATTTQSSHSLVCCRFTSKACINVHIPLREPSVGINSFVSLIRSEPKPDGCLLPDTGESADVTNLSSGWIHNVVDSHRAAWKKSAQVEACLLSLFSPFRVRATDCTQLKPTK